MQKKSVHAKKIDPVLNECCRSITGCLKPTNVDSLYILAGITPPDIRRTVASRAERLHQTTDPRHPLYRHIPVTSRLKSCKSFITIIEPLSSSPESTRLQLWKARLQATSVADKMRLQITETLPPGSVLTDDFFSKLAEEAGRDEESDISEVDPQALLESMKDMDDMDNDLFGTKKKPNSAPSKITAKNSEISESKQELSKVAQKSNAATKEESVAQDEKKPLSAPESSSRLYRKFSFGDFDDPLAGILSDEEDGKMKKVTIERKLNQISSNQSTGKKEDKVQSSPTPARAAAPSRKKDELTFDDEGDDLMDALGIGESPKIQKREETKGEDEMPKPAHSKMDELLGRGTSAKLLERPATGERKEFKLDKKYQKSQEKDDALGKDDFTFGAYQPTVASTPEERQSRRQSIRFSAEDVSALLPDQKPKTSTPMTPGSARASRSGADWLGLKDEDLTDAGNHNFTKDNSKTSVSLDTIVPSSPSPTKKMFSASRPPAGTKLTEEAVGASRSNQSGSRADPPGNKEEDWLSDALSRKKSQMQGKTEERKSNSVDFLGLGEEVDPDMLLSKSVASPSGHQQTLLTGTRDPGTELKSIKPRETGSSFLWENSGRKASPLADTRKAEPAGDPSRPVSANKHNEHMSTALPQLLPSQSLGMSLLNSSENETMLSYRQRQMREANTGQKADLQAAQAQIIELEIQVRKLELERNQFKTLLESLQQHHQEDIELIENTHRNRLKVIEESYQQREARLNAENQELAAQQVSRLQDMEKEKSLLLAQYQRKLTAFEQEKAKEVERLQGLQRMSVLEMKKDHEEQLQRLKRLKDQEIDAVTSATSQTRSLNTVIEQMEAFSHKLNDLSYKVESTHQNTSQELEIGARQRDEQLRVLQDRLSRQQRDMEEERSRLQEVIIKMEIRLTEQGRLLEKERWRVTAEQSKVESLQRSLEEERRVMTKQLAMEREELERAKSALLEEQQTVMQQCAEERRKLAVEWAEFHTQQHLSKERTERDANRAFQIDAQREGTIMSLAKEQAELKIQARELKLKEDQIACEQETLERVRQELNLEKERVNAMALRVKQRAEEIESMSKLASQKYEEGERALLDAKQVESEHKSRLHAIHQQMERLRLQEQQLYKERLNLAQKRKYGDQLQKEFAVNRLTASSNHQTYTSTILQNAVDVGSSDALAGSIASELSAQLALLKHSAEKDRDFLEDEQFFLQTLKKAPYNTFQTA
ncbi:fas-binding factor 1 homolog [Latimeria chalumnae]|uniref:fas-binding factor 1 homolog n=1 Tax=Latimeria chalumnae TaxID=7897 RepID=UPI00313C302B